MYRKRVASFLLASMLIMIPVMDVMAEETGNTEETEK